MSDEMIKSIKLKANFNFERSEISSLIYNSLNIESDYNPNERAQAKLKLDGSNLILSIDAKDAISARASVNSFLKWITLSLELLDNLGKEEKKD